MSGCLFKLETADGAPAEPPRLESAVPNWRAGETIPLGAKTLRVVDVRNDEAVQIRAPRMEAAERCGSAAAVAAAVPKGCPTSSGEERGPTLRLVSAPIQALGFRRD
jgi:hypothetical protein